MSILLNNKLLQAVEQKIESQLLPDTRDAYMRIVVTGMKAALKNGPNGMLAKLKQSKDPVGDAARGAVNLVILINHQAGGKAPPKAIPPAAATLLFQGLDFLDRSGVVKVDATVLGNAITIQQNYLLAKFKVTPQMMSNAAANVHKVMQDPTMMEKINRKAGVVQAPGTSKPTEMPPEAAQ